MTYKAVVVGTSAGGMEALRFLLGNISTHFALPIIIVQHLHPEQDCFFVEYFSKISPLKIQEAEERSPILPHRVYFAPPDYHLLIEKDLRFALSIDQKVSFARPSIDVLFESAAHIYRHELIGIVLTGANRDGARGMLEINKYKGLSIVQNPVEASFKIMPYSVLSLMQPNHVFSLHQIVDFLNHLK